MGGVASFFGRDNGRVDTQAAKEKIVLLGVALVAFVALWMFVSLFLFNQCARKSPERGAAKPCTSYTIRQNHAVLCRAHHGVHASTPWCARLHTMVCTQKHEKKHQKHIG
jgi:hypothetical protein